MKKLSSAVKTNLIYIAGTICILATVLFSNHRATNYVTDPALSKELREANADQRAALEKQQKEYEKNATFLRRQDSINDSKLLQSNTAIQKSINESNKKIDAIRTYSSADIVRAFSELQERK